MLPLIKRSTDSYLNEYIAAGIYEVHVPISILSCCHKLPYQKRQDIKTMLPFQNMDAPNLTRIINKDHHMENFHQKINCFFLFVKFEMKIVWFVYSSAFLYFFFVLFIYVCRLNKYLNSNYMNKHNNILSITTILING